MEENNVENLRRIVTSKSEVNLAKLPGNLSFLNFELKKILNYAYVKYKVKYSPAQIIIYKMEKAKMVQKNILFVKCH